MSNTTPIPISNITNFHFNHKQIRTTNNDDGSIWFVAKDVCQSLDIAWRGTETLSPIPKAWRVVRSFRTTLKNQYGNQGFIEKETIFINEPAVYKLAFRSNKPEADNFTNWVASEVLPTIRKIGSYSQEPEKIAKAFYDAGRKLDLGHNTMRRIVIDGTQNLSGIDISDKMAPHEKPKLQLTEPIHVQLRQIRIKKNKLQCEVALKAFGTTKNYKGMERGTIPISKTELDLILKALGSSRSEITRPRPVNGIQVTGKVFTYIPKLRDLLGLTNTASKIRYKPKKNVQFAGWHMGCELLEACLPEEKSK